MSPKLPQKSMESARDSRKINALGSLAVVEIPRSMLWWTHWETQFTFQLSSGDIHDENIADNVLDHADLNETIVQADKAYGSYCLREYIANRNADFCIPPKSNAVDP